MAAITLSHARRRPVKVGTIIRHAVLIVFMLIILMPLAWVLLLSIKSIPDAYRPGFWPENFDFTHYGYAINNIPTLAPTLLTPAVATPTPVAITTISAGSAGYSIVLLTPKGRPTTLAL